MSDNMHVAHALNARPVTCILIVAKADTRIENTVKTIGEYLDTLLPDEFPTEILGVCITHMDVVSWKKSDILPIIKDDLDIESVVCSSFDMTAEAFKDELMRECIAGRRAVKLDIDSDMFLKSFNISSDKRKVHAMARKEVARFDKMSADFAEQAKKYPDDEMDLSFEFQTWLNEEFVKAQMRFSEKNDFMLLDGPNMAVKAGHVANFRNQIGKFLRLIRIKTEKYLTDIDTNFRSCPHCGEVWAKVEGCEGTTQCGARPEKVRSDNVSTTDQMSNFRFEWDTAAQRVIVTKTRRSTRSSQATAKRPEKKGVGCGKSIKWKDMKPVDVPKEVTAVAKFREVKPLPDDGREKFKQTYDQKMSEMGSLDVKNEPRPAQARLEELFRNCGFE